VGIDAHRALLERAIRVIDTSALAAKVTGDDGGLAIYVELDIVVGCRRKGGRARKHVEQVGFAHHLACGANADPVIGGDAADGLEIPSEGGDVPGRFQGKDLLFNVRGALTVMYLNALLNLCDRSQGGKTPCSPTSRQERIERGCPLGYIYQNRGGCQDYEVKKVAIRTVERKIKASGYKADLRELDSGCSANSGRFAALR
jgi:hypothetical protein